MYPIGDNRLLGLKIPRPIKPLGNPPPNSVKFFAASELLELAKVRNVR
jgi:hypothetical protein